MSKEYVIWHAVSAACGRCGKENMSGLWILSSALLALGVGVILLVWAFVEYMAGTGTAGAIKNKPKDKEAGESGSKLVHGLAIGAMLVAAALALWAAWSGDRSVTLFYLMKNVPICFRTDELSRWFVSMVTAVWVPVGIYSVAYLRHEGGEKRFFGLYLIIYGVLVCLDFAGNLVTMYLFYEMVTLASFPLVLHNGSREAIMAALKYLFYSLCGAYMGLFGIFFLYRYSGAPAFSPGGVLSQEVMTQHSGILLVAVMFMLVGFGAKAGMFPLHAWLPTAHPVAPSPASAVLSGVIVKSGVLAVIRVIYYIVGPYFLRGTWVQYTWIALTLITVFMGSLLAYREPVLKKRLAYSTVSQISYILFGLAVLSPAGFTGALLHVAFHGVVKCGLFLTAGIFLACCGKTKVEELKGIGRRMPAVLWCWTLLSLALIGIPPTCGFVSKWYLAQGALEAGLGVWGYVGTAVLLVSALLTAGYLLPVVTKGFFPGESGACRPENTAGAGRKEPGAVMLVPLIILAALALVMGLFPGILTEYARELAVSALQNIFCK